MLFLVELINTMTGIQIRVLRIENLFGMDAKHFYLILLKVPLLLKTGLVLDLEGPQLDLRGIKLDIMTKFMM